jgi:hypothetical protein
MRPEGQEGGASFAPCGIRRVEPTRIGQGFPPRRRSLFSVLKAGGDRPAWSGEIMLERALLPTAPVLVER